MLWQEDVTYIQSSVTVNLLIINLLPCLQKAMDVIGISDDDQASVLQIVAGVLHLGNISFTEQGNYAVPSDDECMYFSSFCICNILSTFVSVKFILVGCCTCVTYQIIHLQGFWYLAEKKAKFRGIFRANSRKNLPNSRDFHGKKVKSRGKIGRFRGISAGAKSKFVEKSANFVGF